MHPGRSQRTFPKCVSESTFQPTSRTYELPSGLAYPPLEQIALGYLPHDYHLMDDAARWETMFRAYFPEMMDWLATWKAYAAGNPGVLVSRYEDFHRDNEAEFKRLLRFVGRPDSGAAQVIQTVRSEALQGRHNFREGEVAGWKGHVTPEISDIIQTCRQPDVLDFFGY